MATYRARQGMASSTRVVPAGAHLDGADPFVIANPGYFELIDGDPAPVEPVVEQATAAPGEKRASRARKPKD